MKNLLRSSENKTSPLSVDTDNMFKRTTRIQKRNYRNKVKRNSKPQKQYNLIAIWLQPGKMDWQPIPYKTRKVKADIGDISKSINRKKVVVEIHQDCPQKVLSNVNWKNHLKLPNT